MQMMLAAEVHLGTKNCDFQMERYVFNWRNDGIYIINLGKTWEKLHLAARAIVSIENPQDIIVQSARPYGQRPVLKFAQYTGAHAIAGRHTPGTLTNQLQTSYNGPRLLILTDPGTDHQRTPEEAKQQEEDEVDPVQDYAMADFNAAAADGQWPTTADQPWTDTAPQPIPALPGINWTPEAAAGDWGECVPAPQITAPAIESVPAAVRN